MKWGLPVACSGVFSMPVPAGSTAVLAALRETYLF
jgi:hypothetical protein